MLITRDLSLSGTESWELVREELVCVGAPALVANHHARSRRHWPMVAARSRPDLVARWAVATETAPDELRVIATYDHLFLAVTAAIAGTGFLVAPRLLVHSAIATGALVLADEHTIGSGATYVAYVNPHSAHTQSAVAFCRWLKGMLRDYSRSVTTDVLTSGGTST
ncbi:LysR substrate-binding domain-containing protein [Verticiella alkaliphila]|uniref:LysR substrate-binding domain-containing protein n=1 Tax=Verticiella alkaliphila TaxID=2779529 RepID=UPI0035301CE0